jgi:hypothetical protein
VSLLLLLAQVITALEQEAELAAETWASKRAAGQRTRTIRVLDDDSGRRGALGYLTFAPQRGPKRLSPLSVVTPPPPPPPPPTTTTTTTTTATITATAAAATAPSKLSLRVLKAPQTQRILLAAVVLRELVQKGGRARGRRKRRKRHPKELPPVLVTTKVMTSMLSSVRMALSTMMMRRLRRCHRMRLTTLMICTGLGTAVTGTLALAPRTSRAGCQPWRVRMEQVICQI